MPARAATPRPFDGEAALRHAAALAALGPHPWGSPRGQAAAQYVAARFREAGLQEVHLQSFESHGHQGSNVIGVLPARGGRTAEFVVVGAHHDTAPQAPGAYDDGGGVGVLIEAARALAAARARPRTLVFVSWDGEEAWSTGQTLTAGSRAYLASLGADARGMVAAFVVEMCGWSRGRPVLHPIAYPDPLRPGAPVIAPAWLVRAAQRGAASAGVGAPVGDPWISWLYQPAVRTFRVGLYGDDLSFLQGGRPALFTSDSSFTAYYPFYHLPADTADKLDPAALARAGRLTLGVVEALAREPAGPMPEPDWFSIFGTVLGRSALLAIGVLSLAPALYAAARRGGPAFGVRLAQAAAFGLLLWRHPVPALWVFLLPNLAPLVRPRVGTTIVAALPLLSLAGVGLLAGLRGMASGLWIAWWELALAALALVLALARPGRGARETRPRSGRRR
ncbi:MAG TPA: M20/M25/M40 family metallo-hydrolase [Vicinamibacteria bacterium]